jgi:hypothetical protein
MVADRSGGASSGVPSDKLEGGEAGLLKELDLIQANLFISTLLVVRLKLNSLIATISNPEET